MILGRILSMSPRNTLYEKCFNINHFEKVFCFSKPVTDRSFSPSIKALENIVFVIQLQEQNQS